MASIKDYGERAEICLQEIENNRDNADAAILYVREVLAIVKQKDNGISNFYCKLVSSLANCDLYRVICEHYLSEFLSEEYNPTDDSISYSLYGTLADSCAYLLGKHTQLDDPLHFLYFNAFLKYGNLDIEFREKVGKDKYRGIYNLAVVLHNEYSSTKNEEYRVKAEKLYNATLNTRWGQFASQCLKSLNSVK